jgi:hypothetical protein
VKRLATIVKLIIVPLIGAIVTAWMEHRTSAVQERSDAAYAVTTPVLRDLQTEQVKLAAQVEILTKLLTAHVLEPPVAPPVVVVPRERPHRITTPAPTAPAGGGLSGYGGGSLGSLGVGKVIDQRKIAERLREAPSNMMMQQRSLPDSPDEALMLQKASKK